MLHALKCNNGLGYLFARPRDTCAATKWLAARVPADGSPILMLLQQNCDGVGRRTRQSHREAASAVLSLQPTDMPA